MTDCAKRSSRMSGMAIRSLPSRKLSFLSRCSAIRDRLRHLCVHASGRTHRLYEQGFTKGQRKGRGSMIKAGDKIPAVNIRVVKPDTAQEMNAEEFFKGKKVALFAVPGAFTSTCSAKHLPSFANNAEAFKKKGVDVVACIAVNDP